MVLLKEDVLEIPGIEISPLGVADQLRIDKTGEFVKHLRITHDLYFQDKYSGELVNSRVNTCNLEPCMFGHTFLRIIHNILQFRLRYPDKIIWICK